MLAILFVWALAATPPTAVVLPQGLEAAMVLHDVRRAGADVAAFCAGGKQRTLATATAKLKERSRQEFGVDVLDAGALQALGVQEGSAALVWMPRAVLPVLALGNISEKTLRGGLSQALAGRYTTASVRQVQVSKVTLNALTLGDVVTPRVLWGSASGQMFVAGPRNKEALAAAVAHMAATTDVHWAESMVHQTASNPNTTFSILHRYGREPTSSVWHSVGVTLTGAGLDGVAMAPPPAQGAHAGAPSCQNLQSHGEMAKRMREALAPGALASASGASLANVAAGHGMMDLAGMGVPKQSPATTHRGDPVSARLWQLFDLLPGIKEVTRDIDVPFAVALYDRKVAGEHVPWRQRIDWALVAHGSAPQHKAQVQLLAKRLIAAYGHNSTSCAASHGAELRKGATRCLIAQGVALQLTVTPDTLFVVSHPTEQMGRLQALLKALQQESPPSATQGTHEPLPMAYADGNFEAMALLLERAIAMESHRILGPNAQSLGLPQLLLAGPTGDMLRELGALHQGTVQARCDGGRPRVVASIRFLDTAP